jgi:hypothetical protein
MHAGIQAVNAAFDSAYSAGIRTLALWNTNRAA